MLRIAFSTTACPDWTIERVARAAAEYGFSGVELRSFGAGGTEMACDPALTDGSKIQRVFDDAGVLLTGVATGVRFDAPVFPPVVGHLLPDEGRSVREGRHLVDVSVGCQARYMRVYGFEIQGRESRSSALRRIVDRLSRVVDHARHRDLQIVIENGGTFSRAEDLAEIIRGVGSPLLRACYDVQAARAAGDDVVAGVRMLGGDIAVARVRDRRGQTPCMVGEGDLGCREFVEALAGDERAGDAWVVFTWDRLWLPDLAPAEEVLPEASRRLASWAGTSGSAGAAA